MMKNKSIKFNALLNAIRTILNVFFPLITFPYISRVLSTEEIGMYNFSGTIVSYFMLIASLGFYQYALRDGVKHKNSREEMSVFASKVFSLNLLSTLISYVLLFLVILVSSKLQDYYFCILILSVQIIFTTLGLEWIYSIFEEYSYITIRNIAFKIISIILLFFLVKHEGDYLVYTLITVIACVGSNILNLLNCKKFCEIKLSYKFNWKPIIKPVMIIFASNIAIQIYVNSDIIILGYLKGDYSVGIYSISTKIYEIVKNVIASILAVTIIRFSLYVEKQQKVEFYTLLIKVINTLVLISVPAIVGLLLLSDNIIFVIAGEKYKESSVSFCILSVAVIFAIFNGLLNACVLLPYKREVIFFKCTIFTAFLNILLNFIFIPLLSEIGAAITTLTSEVTLFIMLCINSKDLIGLTFTKNESIQNYLSVLVSSIFIIVICILMNNYFSNIYIATAISVIFSMIAYIISLVILKNWIMLSVINDIKHSIYHKLREKR